MSVKLILLVIIVLLITLAIAFYTRAIDIDAIIRRNDPTKQEVSILVYNLDNRYEASKVGEGFIIDGYRLRFFSSTIPAVVIKVSELKTNEQLFVFDATGKKFLLGKITSTVIKDSASQCFITVDPGDKLVFKSSYSVFPYYYGFYILSPGRISRYYHYYSLHIKKKSGGSLLLEWKFSTYKGENGKLVPDLFGDNKEGLVKALIE